MPIRGGKKVRRNTRRLVGRIKGRISEQTMTEILIIGEMYAADLTPVDTSTLINSRYRVIENTITGTKGIVGYTANYAAAVHDGGPKNWQKPGAEDEFLRKGFEERGRSQIAAHVRRRYRL